MEEIFGHIATGGGTLLAAWAVMKYRIDQIEKREDKTEAYIEKRFDDVSSHIEKVNTSKNSMREKFEDRFIKLDQRLLEYREESTRAHSDLKEQMQQMEINIIREFNDKLNRIT